MKQWGAQMLHKSLFILVHTLKYRDFMECYKFVKKNEYESYENLKRYQEEKLQRLIQFSYDKVPYYHKLFKSLNLKPENIRSIEDLQKLPILTKEIIRDNQKDFVPLNLKDQKYVVRTTGGSTGVPLQYRLSMQNGALAFDILYANWGYAGYELGDKVAVIAGSSLIPSTKSKIIGSIKEYMVNFKEYSSFDLSEKYMDNIIIRLSKFKPKYLKGFPSSMYLFAKHIKNRDLKIDFQPEAVFTTAEVLFNSQRELIEGVFNCEVFDQYGLNDGGVTAFECGMHKGLHIDMIRSIMEIVDENGNQLGSDKEGEILATSLHNYAMPFIRYDTHDLGIVSDKKCTCGRELPLLKKIVGRTTDILEFPDNMVVSGAAVVDMFKYFSDKIREYQVVQKEQNVVLIRIVKDTAYSKNDSELIIKAFQGHVGTNIEINIEFVDHIETTKAGKWKFIVREMG